MLVQNTIALVAGVVLITALTVADGARGAAIATMGGEIALWASGVVMLRRSGAAPGSTSARTLPGVMIAVGAGIATGLASGLPSAVAAVLALAVCAVGLIMFRTVPQEILVELRRLARGR